MPDQGSSFVELVLLTVLGKLYKELHSIIQNSPELSIQFPSLATAHSDLIAAAVSTVPAPLHKTGKESGVAVMGPVPNPALHPAADGSPATAGRSTPQKPLIAQALQLTGAHATLKPM